MFLSPKYEAVIYEILHRCKYEVIIYEILQRCTISVKSRCS
jgi:hypothetical protein